MTLLSTTLVTLLPFGGACVRGAATTADPDAGVAIDASPSAGSPDQTGFGDSVFSSGGVDASNPFFIALGTNGRACATCHVQADGWTIKPSDIQARFAATNGTDPLFSLVDGANSPIADVSTPAAIQAAYSMLLTKGVIRIGMPVPVNAEFTLTAVDDPYGYASASELSLFRRPLPSTNLRFLSSVMWDGREPSLASQATDATLGHAQATTTDPAQIAEIVSFESEISTAQAFDTGAGALDAGGATGGPTVLASVTFQPGENDPFSGAPFDRGVFELYAAWGTAGATPETRKQSIARGQQIFDTRPIAITGVAGLNDQLGLPTVQGSCSTCHDAPSAGNHSVALLLDLGLVAPIRRTPDQPLYTFRRISDGTTIQTTDPGLALVTGAWSDMNRFKVPVLRGLAMRPPYFHNGSAPTLQAVVGFYDARFRIGLSPQDQADLVAFLESL